MDRRLFMKSIGAGVFALSGAAVPQRARGAPPVERSFVFAYFSGGWDTLLCLDPRDPSVFTESRVGATGIQLGWDRLPERYPRAMIRPRGSTIAFGPVMTRIAQHHDRMCVVRGISMDTVTHEVGRRYFLTGLPPRGLSAAGSAMGTRIAAQQGDRTPIPHLVARVETYNESDPPFASGLSVQSGADLVAALKDGPAAPKGAVRARLDEYRASRDRCDPGALDRKGFLGLVSSAQSKARSVVSSGISSKFAFLSTTDPEMEAIRTRYGFTTLDTPGAQAALAFQAVKHGIAQCVSVELARGLDTHDATWATAHPDNLAAGFDALAQLVTDLSAEPHDLGGKLIDHTTIVVFSEFGRTARINGRDGRDHALTSSCMLLGAGVPHDRVIGQSSDRGMNPTPIDPRTGRPSSSGVTISPALVLASIMRSAGLDAAKLRTDGLPCLMG